MMIPYITRYVNIFTTNDTTIITENVEITQPDELQLSSDDFTKQTATIESTDPDEFIAVRETRSIESSDPDELFFKK